MTTVFSGDACAPAAPEGAGQWLSMERDDTCRFSDVFDFAVHCREGKLWITSPEEPGDTVVGAGEQLSVTSRGTIMVGALAPSSMWVPEGFAVEDDSEGSTRRRMGLRKLRVPAPQRPAPHASDESRRPAAEVVRLAPFRRFMLIMSRILSSRRSTDAADARERYLSRSADHEDFENRVRAWDAHEVRVRSLPPVL